MEKLLKIAFVTETYPPEINGVAKTIAKMVQNLRSRGYFLQVFRPKQGIHDGNESQNNGQDITLPGLKIPVYRDLNIGLPSTRFLLKAWKSNPPDLVHIVTEGPLGWSAVRAAKRLRLPIISDFHTNFHSYSRYYHLGILQNALEKYLRSFHNHTDCTLVPTRELEKILSAKGYKKVEVVGRGVDAKLFSPRQRDPDLRKSWGLTENDIAVLYVGRLAAEKNIHLILNAFDCMHFKNPGLRLVLVGDGPRRKHLQHKYPCVIFPGMQRGEALARYYASGDIFLFPSITETFGNVILEALASGLAIVAFDYAAAREYLRHNESAFLAPFNNQPEFIKLASSLAECPDTIERLRRAAQEKAKACTWEDIISQLEQVYFSLIYLKEKKMLQYVVKDTMGKMDRLEAPVCLVFNRFSQKKLFYPLFVCVSKLGNGFFWYFFMVGLPLMYGPEAIKVVVQMLLTGSIGVFFYKLIKSHTSRLRPFQTQPEVRGPVQPLDQYSFPSGHTLHAVAFTVMLVSHYPVLGWITIPFTILVALSRVILGLHYPSDVLAGVASGYFISEFTFLIYPTA